MEQAAADIQRVVRTTSTSVQRGIDVDPREVIAAFGKTSEIKTNIGNHVLLAHQDQEEEILLVCLLRARKPGVREQRAAPPSLGCVKYIAPGGVERETNGSGMGLSAICT